MIHSPASPYPGTMFTTPLGRPACSKRADSEEKLVSGVRGRWRVDWTSSVDSAVPAAGNNSLATLRATGSTVETSECYDITRVSSKRGEKALTGKTGQLGGLEDDGVSASESGSDLPGEHEDGEVPGNDLR